MLQTFDTFDILFFVYNQISVLMVFKVGKDSFLILSTILGRYHIMFTAFKCNFFHDEIWINQENVNRKQSYKNRLIRTKNMHVATLVIKNILYFQF